ncbi:hypothetical protein Y032_0097g2976 [Ancylostoma ceylanicum]|uniref:Uncharacterized protein n=1 Tax=Ancylostoma ceylanicum TaxID=53326 RepID=A0A016TJT9_9BILA|nr:hypothetical protein Y032_0097g2976 [Ancylostoma ceylanicum]
MTDLEAKFGLEAKVLRGFYPKYTHNKQKTLAFELLSWTSVAQWQGGETVKTYAATQPRRTRMLLKYRLQPRRASNRPITAQQRTSCHPAGEEA